MYGVEAIIFLHNSLGKWFTSLSPQLKAKVTVEHLVKHGKTMSNRNKHKMTTATWSHTKGDDMAKFTGKSGIQKEAEDRKKAENADRKRLKALIKLVDDKYVDEAVLAMARESPMPVRESVRFVTAWALRRLDNHGVDPTLFSEEFKI